MGFVLADQHGWLDASASPSQQKQQPFSDTVVLQTFEKLRAAVNAGDADFFMWEHFTSKRYHDLGEVRRVGDIYTPWSSWKIVAATALTGQGGGGPDERLGDLFAKLDRGVEHFNRNPDEAVEYISTKLDYTAADAREWLKTVRFPSKVEGVKAEVVENCVSILRKAGVLVEGKGIEPKAMIV